MVHAPEILVNSLFYILLLNFILICILFILNRKDIFSYFRKIRKITWVIFILILVFGSGLRIAFPGCSDSSGLCWNHVVRGQIMLEEQKIYEFKYSSGYPFMVALSFFFFGASFESVLFLNLLMSSLTILLVFLLTWTLFKKDSVSLFSTLIYSLLPASVYFAKLNASEVISTFFATIAVLIFLISLELGKKRLYYLSGLLLVFAIHARLDNSIFIPFFILGFLLKRKDISFKNLKLPIILFLIFMIPVSYYYITVNENFGTWNDPVVSETHPYTFSHTYLIPNIARHFSFLARPGDYPLILYLFLFISLLFIRREKNVLFPVFWIALFLLFYGLYWASYFSGLDLYHLLLHPALAILIAYGIFSVKNVLERCSEKILSIKFSPNMKMFTSVIILFLIFSVFFFNTNVFAFEEEGNCLMTNMLSVSGSVGSNDCLLIENPQSWYLSTNSNRMMKIIFHGKNVTTSLDRCEGEIFYMYVDTATCAHSFFGEEKPLMDKLKNETVLTEVDRKGCVTLYRVDTK
ncbi:MAG: glycosyltransferase family 39 protein [Candidatus Aenigmatarchaeota archaeon]|nr:MAG: glycosyltransferase family 39 protein [Candidatus Aenigmarchaeota archaeon]